MRDLASVFEKTNKATDFPKSSAEVVLSKMIAVTSELTLLIGVVQKCQERADAIVAKTKSHMALAATERVAGLSKALKEVKKKAKAKKKGEQSGADADLKNQIRDLEKQLRQAETFVRSNFPETLC